MSKNYRSHNCNELRKSDIGTKVQLCGWVHAVRDHKGVIFIDLRDREGLTQIVFRQEVNESAAKLSHNLHNEDVIQITGEVCERLITEDADTTNAKLATGEIEVVASQLKILSKSQIIPFQVANPKELPNEEIRLANRFLDLRREQLAQNLRIRNDIALLTRNFFAEKGFTDIETPILTKSTPEGARDFLLPSRLNPGKFYALPQAPQQYKQLLMIAGIEKYFQIARCFRDEDLRADRQPEFTQIDLELSFTDTEEITSLIDDYIKTCYEKILGIKLKTPFPRITFQTAMNRWGSDKPDLRFGMELNDVSEIFAKTEFKVFQNVIKKGGVIKAINAKNFAYLSTGQINRLTDIAIEAGAKGLAYIKVEEDNWKSPIVKFFSEDEKKELAKKLDMQTGDLILFAADSWLPACEVLGRIRIEVANYQNLIDKKKIEVLWVVDFPLLHFDKEENRWNAIHHPFTRPKDEDLETLKDQKNLDKIRAESYDLVINGFEIGGGSIRIHEQDLQKKIFGILGISEKEQREQFGHLLKAFSFGAPPHGGIALGFDRLCMLMCGEKSIRDVIAFPKNNKGVDLLLDAPATVGHKQLREYYIKSTFQEKSA